jgi:hypothetical protein
MDDFHGIDLGTKVMDFIKSWFIDPHNKTGCEVNPESWTQL